MTGTPEEPEPDHRPPQGAEVARTWPAPDGRRVDYVARAGWTVLRRTDKPVAEVFSVSYAVPDAAAGRPVTFVVNGGPGAASCYLHVGAVGPRRVAFPADGSQPRPPARLVDNAESWLAFTDLVFVDPVGTGFSRVIPAKDGGAGGSPEAGGTSRTAADPGPSSKDGASSDPATQFFGIKGDLESLAEFITRWLSQNGRWDAPVLLAGESYGGFRVARMARLLHESSGVGVNGIVVISPALEFAVLDTSDYDALHWINLLPTMALAASHHGRSRAFAPGTDEDQIRVTAESFATGQYATFLARGISMPEAERAAVLRRFGDLVGLDPDVVDRTQGRIPLDRFARELLRDQRRVIGWYDVTVTASDPFPDREPFGGADPTLYGIGPAFTGAINTLVRQEIGVDTERDYHTLSEDVNKAWRVDLGKHALDSQIGATDDLRAAMALNPHLQVFVCHGWYDMVTPYFSSDRIVNLMRLDQAMAARLSVRHFHGGHMFYTWEASRQALRDEVAVFTSRAVD